VTYRQAYITESFGSLLTNDEMYVWNLTGNLHHQHSCPPFRSANQDQQIDASCCRVLGAWWWPAWSWWRRAAWPRRRRPPGRRRGRPTGAPPGPRASPPPFPMFFLWSSELLSLLLGFRKPAGRCPAPRGQPWLIKVGEEERLRWLFTEGCCCLQNPDGPAYYYAAGV